MLPNLLHLPPVAIEEDRSSKLILFRLLFLQYQLIPSLYVALSTISLSIGILVLLKVQIGGSVLNGLILIVSPPLARVSVEQIGLQLFAFVRV